ncbi:MAG: hypothetical protein AAFS12_18085 [Cyanobacteria bacterium J06632_19]
MTKANFSVMSDKELRAYVLTNKHDQHAFHVYCDRIYAKPGVKVTSWEQFQELIREKEGINR